MMILKLFENEVIGKSFIHRQWQV